MGRVSGYCVISGELLWIPKSAGRLASDRGATAVTLDATIMGMVRRLTMEPTGNNTAYLRAGSTESCNPGVSP